MAISQNPNVYMETMEKPKTKVKNLLKMGVPEDLAWQAGMK